MELTTARLFIVGQEADFMGVASNIRRYRDGIIRIGIPFAILNLAIVCAICVSLAGLGYTASISSSLMEMPAGSGASDLARSNQILFWGILLTLAIFPILSLIVSTLAGILSSGVNAVRDEKEAAANGRVIGVTMWAVIMMAGLGVFIILLVGSINYFSRSANWPVLAFIVLIAAIPVVLILWAFTSFSVIGSRMFLRANTGADMSISKVLAIFKKSLTKGERAWIKTAIGALVVTWTVLLFYGIFAFIMSLH